MREILFKAKRKDNGKWVEGHYYKMSEQPIVLKRTMNGIQYKDITIFYKRE